MNRRQTPDSEAVASSEDDVPWPQQTFGSMPRKENGVPGLGGGIWAQSTRGSFKLDQEARRKAAIQARLGNNNNGNTMQSLARSTDTPSPTMSDDRKSLPFSIPLRPTTKPGRSLSHSQGQREVAPMLHALAGATDRSSLDLVNETEEADTDSEPEIGNPLTQTTSHPGLGLFQRTSTFPQQYPSMLSQGERHRADTFNDASLTEGLGNALEGMRLDGLPNRSKQRWQTSSGWDELHTINESRRHSLAGELPTRRGSLAESHEEHDMHTTRLGYTDQRNINDVDTFNIPEGYRVPQMTLDAQERAGIQQAINMHAAQSRPRKELYIVSFKCSRAGVFYLLDNTGLTVEEGHMVIVEADRGQDLGTVQHARVSPEEARALLQKYSEEQYKWLMMFSRNNQAGAVNPNAAVYGESNNNNSQDYSRPNMPSARAPRDQFQNLKPKAIKRMAAPHEIRMLKEKEGNEAKAKRCCQQKVFQHHLDMEILEAEFQWDWQKLIFYYYADHYVNFKELVNDLYKLYKVRLWMSAVNPASFSPNAINQPPSGIGPGAITSFDAMRTPDFDNSYAMAYGNDPDPYGAVPPYQVGYNTYVPNYPSIPGVPNSFAPTPGDGTPAQPIHGQWPGASGAMAMSSSTVTAGLTSPSSSTPRGINSPFVPAFVNPLMSGPNRGGSYSGPMMQPSTRSGRTGSESVQSGSVEMPNMGWNQARPQFSYPLSPSLSFANRQQQAQAESGSANLSYSAGPGHYNGNANNPTYTGNQSFNSGYTSPQQQGYDNGNTQHSYTNSRR